VLRRQLKHLSLAVSKAINSIKLTLVNALENLSKHSFQFIIEAYKVLILNSSYRESTGSLVSYTSANNGLHILLKANLFVLELADYGVLVKTRSCWLCAIE